MWCHVRPWSVGSLRTFVRAGASAHRLRYRQCRASHPCSNRSRKAIRRRKSGRATCPGFAASEARPAGTTDCPTREPSCALALHPRRARWPSGSSPPSTSSKQGVASEPMTATGPTALSTPDALPAFLRCYNARSRTRLWPTRRQLRASAELPLKRANCVEPHWWKYRRSRRRKVALCQVPDT